MTAPIVSPDGKWLWDGSKWIPAPPTTKSSIDVNLHDSVGDVHIVQNNVEDIASAMVNAMKVMFDNKNDEQSKEINFQKHHELATAECSGCRAIIPLNSKHCPKCNLNFSGVSEGKLGECNACKGLVPLDSAKCIHCGNIFGIE